MILEARIKQTALLAAVDICLKRAKRAPLRSARNLTELGLVAYPNKLTKKERNDFHTQVLQLCKDNNYPDAKQLFIDTFIQEQDA